MSIQSPTMHFLSGLPRSGSTLLSAILGQNPDIRAGMTSPMFSFVSGLLPQLSNASEFNVFVDNDARDRLLRGLFDNYYAGQSAPIIIDTNRHWTSRMALLTRLFPQARFICCVRPLPQIVQSFESLFAANPAELSRLINFDAGTNVYSRVDYMMGPAGLVGFPLNALKEAFYGAWSDRLMLVSYARLCASPREVIAGVYQFLGLQAFEHDFGALALDTGDYDRTAGSPGLHKVRRELMVETKPVTLPPDIIARLQGPYFWETPQGTRANTRFAR